MIACGAGPVVGRTLKLTNAPWVMDGPETARRAGLGQGLLLNDFEAQALSLPAIPEDWTRRIGPLKFGARWPAGDSGTRHGARDRGAGRGRRAFHPGVVGGVPHRFRSGFAGRIRALAPSRARARAHHQRERHLRRRACARSSRAHDGEGSPRSARPSRRLSPRRRWPTRRAKRRRASGSIGASSRASPATWR